jgi:glycosyltransferase involved in cell wall biosynthesis
MKPLKLNVVLVTYNSAPYIQECVASVLMQKTNFRFNIIVADDCSTDGSFEMIKNIEKTFGGGA